MRPLGVALPLLLAAATLTAAPAQASTPTCDGHAATIVGTDKADRIRGTSGPDVIVGLGGNDNIYGAGGDDIVCGGYGADVLKGGAGDDRLFGQQDWLSFDRGGTFLVGDTLRGGAGDDHLNGGYDRRRANQEGGNDTVSYGWATHAVRVNLDRHQASGPGQGTDSIVLSPRLAVEGSPYADTMVGSAGPDTLRGLGGPDLLDGLAGDDVLSGDAEVGEPDRDQLFGGDGDDLLTSERGEDQLFGGDGDDTIEADSRAPSEVQAGPGDDSVRMFVTRGSGFAILGGPGHNELDVYTTFAGARPRSTVTVDMRGRRVTSSVGSTGQVGDFTDVHLVDDVTWVYEGTDAAERLEVNFGGPLRARMYGGDDVVFGSLTGGDTIDGGDGSDTVDADGTCTNVEAGTCS